MAVTEIRKRTSNDEGIYIKLELKEFKLIGTEKATLKDHAFLSASELKLSATADVAIWACNMVEIPKKYVIVELDEHEQAQFIEQENAIQTTSL
jgi:hypothetical protein